MEVFAVTPYSDNDNESYKLKVLLYALKRA